MPTAAEREHMRRMECRSPPARSSRKKRIGGSETNEKQTGTSSLPPVYVLWMTLGMTTQITKKPCGMTKKLCGRKRRICGMTMKIYGKEG